MNVCICVCVRAWMWLHTHAHRGSKSHRRQGMSQMCPGPQPLSGHSASRKLGPLAQKHSSGGQAGAAALPALPAQPRGRGRSPFSSSSSLPSLGLSGAPLPLSCSILPIGPSLKVCRSPWGRLLSKLAFGSVASSQVFSREVTLEWVPSGAYIFSGGGSPTHNSLP